MSSRASSLEDLLADVHMSESDEALFREIQAEQDQEEMERRGSTADRGSILLSPLLMAAMAGGGAKGDNSTAASPRLPDEGSKGLLPDESYQSSHFGEASSFGGNNNNNDEGHDDDLDGEINEDDLQFGRRFQDEEEDVNVEEDDLDGEINDDDLQFGLRRNMSQVEEDDKAAYDTTPADATDVDEAHSYDWMDWENENKRDLRARRIRWVLIALIAVAIIVTLTSIVLIVTQERSDPSLAGNVPTDGSNLPSMIPTQRPSETPSPTFEGETRSPTFRPTPRPTRNPTPRPTIVFDTPNPSVRLTPFPTRSPPPPSPPTLEPTLSPGELLRVAEVTRLLLDLSGVLVFTNPNSPQSKAKTWILHQDSQRLSASDLPSIVQRYAMAILYFATDGSNTWQECAPTTAAHVTDCLSVTNRYLSGSTECTWKGTTCLDGVVTGINLRENGLQGSLPPEIKDLVFLEQIILTRNTITGSIPTELSALNRLRFLMLNRNEFGGSIPTELGRLTAMEYLHLGNNRLTGTIASEIFVNRLSYIDLGVNRLTGPIPRALYSGAPLLVNVDLADNRLTGSLPSGLQFLSALKRFSVDKNQLTGTIPASSFRPKSLVLFDAGQNHLDGDLPRDLFNFGTSLTTLNLEFNDLRGTIPSRLSELTSLEQLILLSNSFAGTIPPSLGALQNLQTLQLGNNSLIGTMPDEICSLSLPTLSADCGGVSPDVVCDCCSVCY